MDSLDFRKVQQANRVKNSNICRYKKEKQFVIDCLNDILNIGPEDIHIDGVHPMGWGAIIRTPDVDLVFTYYANDCWKLETLPVHAIEGARVRVNEEYFSTIL